MYRSAQGNMVLFPHGLAAKMMGPGLFKGESHCLRASGSVAGALLPSRCTSSLAAASYRYFVRLMGQSEAMKAPRTPSWSGSRTNTAATSLPSWP